MEPAKWVWEQQLLKQKQERWSYWFSAAMAVSTLHPLAEKASKTGGRGNTAPPPPQPIRSSL